MRTIHKYIQHFIYLLKCFVMLQYWQKQISIFFLLNIDFNLFFLQERGKRVPMIVRHKRYSRSLASFMTFYKSWLLTAKLMDIDDPLAKYKQPKPDSTAHQEENGKKDGEVERFESIDSEIFLSTST